MPQPSRPARHAVLVISVGEASQVVGMIGGVAGLVAMAGQVRVSRAQKRLEAALRLRPLKGVYPAPPMPEFVDGYRAADERMDDLSMRIFDGTPRVWSAFPVTMNGCMQRYWTMRWRSTEPIVIYKVAYNYDPSDPLDRRCMTAGGNTGLVHGGGCEQPLFVLDNGSEPNRSTLADLIAEVRFWQLAP